MLFDLLFGRRIDDSEVGLDDNVGYERIVDGSTEICISCMSDIDRIDIDL